MPGESTRSQEHMAPSRPFPKPAPRTSPKPPTHAPPNAISPE